MTTIDAEPSSSSQEPQVIQKGPACNSAVVRYLSLLLGDETTSDLTLAVESSDKTFRVHKLVLAQSPVFRSMLYGQGWREAQSDRVVLTERPPYADDLDTFLQYLYAVSVQLTWQNIGALVYYADKYAVQSLLDDCLDFFVVHAQKNGNLLSAVNAWRVIRGTVTHHHGYTEPMFRILACNVERLAELDSVIDCLDESDVAELLRSDDLVCRTEFGAYKLVETWLLSLPADARLPALRTLFPLVRLPYMHVQELSYVERSPRRLFPDDASEEDFNACQTLVKLRLCDAYKFHIMEQSVRQQLELPLPPPRLYLDHACMKYRLHNVSDLTSWAKVRSSYTLHASFSKADQSQAKLSHGFAVNLMRKINAGPLGAIATDKNRSSLLSLEIIATDAMKPHHYSRGFVFVHKKKPGGVIRKLLTAFDVSGSHWEVKLDGISFDKVSKRSEYFLPSKSQAEGARHTYLSLDIFLTP